MSVVRKLLLVSLPIVLLCVAFLEFELFRYVVVVDSTPLAAYDPDAQMLKYVANQTGTRYPDRDRRHPVHYSINQDGWNSAHRAYERVRNGRRRVAVIGDSYVEALQVNLEQAVAARLEELLTPSMAEVYSFGISGAPLSQYLHIARYVSTTYHPDAIVVVLVHNDFIESYRPKVERFSSSFLHFDLKGEAVHEVPPVPYERQPMVQWLLARSATLRLGFFVWRSLAEKAAEAAPHAGDPTARYEANINVQELRVEEPRIRRSAEYAFGQFARLAESDSVPVLLVMDGAREALYEGKDPSSLEVSRLNRIAADTAAAAGLTFLDLTNAFAEDYARRYTRFEFATDNHWNADAHRLVAAEIAHRLPSRASPSTR